MLLWQRSNATPIQKPAQVHLGWRVVLLWRRSNATPIQKPAQVHLGQSKRCTYSSLSITMLEIYSKSLIIASGARYVYLETKNIWLFPRKIREKNIDLNPRGQQSQHGITPFHYIIFMLGKIDNLTLFRFDWVYWSYFWRENSNKTFLVIFKQCDSSTYFFE